MLATTCNEWKLYDNETENGGEGFCLVFIFIFFFSILLLFSPKFSVQIVLFLSIVFVNLKFIRQITIIHT